MTMPLQAADLVVEIIDESSGHCACCGCVSRCIWGYINKSDATIAVYYARWTQDHVMETGASFDIIIGPWGEATTSTDRTCVSLLYGREDDGPWSVMVVDASDAGPVRSGIAGSGLRRDEVIGTPLAPQVFTLIDVIFLQDHRLFSSDAAGREDEEEAR